MLRETLEFQPTEGPAQLDTTVAGHYYNNYIKEEFIMSNKKSENARLPQEEQKTVTINITARAYPVSGDGPVLAGLTFDMGGVMAIRGAKLIDGKNGPFVSMPQRQTKDGYQEVVFPITKEMRELVNSTAVEAYQLALKEMTEKLGEHRQAQQAAAPEQEQSAAPGMGMAQSM